MSHRDVRDFSSKSFWKHFLIVLKILLQVLIILSYFFKHSDVAYQEKNTLGNLKNWFMSHRDVFSKCWKKFVKVFFVDQIIKRAKNQNWQPIMSHRDARGFSSKSFWKHFLIVLKILLQVPIIPSYFYKHSDVAYQEKNTLGNLKNWITSHRDVFIKCWKKFVKVFFSYLNLLGS